MDDVLFRQVQYLHVFALAVTIAEVDVVPAGANGGDYFHGKHHLQRLRGFFHCIYGDVLGIFQFAVRGEDPEAEVASQGQDVLLLVLLPAHCVKGAAGSAQGIGLGDFAHAILGECHIQEGVLHVVYLLCIHGLRVLLEELVRRLQGRLCNGFIKKGSLRLGLGAKAHWYGKQKCRQKSS